jgi:hypothetical protein
MKRNLILALVTLILTACRNHQSLTPTVAPEKEIELIGHIGGVTKAVLAHGDYLYAGFGSELAILDISNPISPERMGYVILPGLVEDISVAGRYAYVYASRHEDHSDHTGQLSVIDISDPKAPFEIGHVRASGRVVEIEGNRAYVAYWDKLTILDASKPETPIQIEVFNAPAPINAMTMAGHLAYIGWGICYRAACTRGMSVLNVSDPTAPKVVGSSDAISFGSPVVSVGHYIYAGPNMIDVSQPAEPVGAGRWTKLEGRPTSIAVTGDRAYVANDQGVLTMLDVSNPESPVEMGAHRVLPPTNSALTVVGDHVYVANGNAGGLHVIDVSNPEAFVQVGQYEAPGKAADLAVADGYAYLANSDGDHWMVNVSEPARPIQVSSRTSWVQSPSVGGHVAVARGYVYIAHWTSLQILSVSDPYAPDFVRTLFFRSLISAIAASKDYLYVATIDDRHGTATSRATLWAIDISDPDLPLKAGKLELEEDFDPMYIHLTSLSVADNYLYATSQAGLWVIDVSDVANPTKVRVRDTPGVAASVAVVDDYAYIADGLSGLRVFDVSDPTAAADVGYHGISAYTRDVAVGDGYVYIVNNSEGLWAFDISNPAAPTQPRNFYLPGRARIDVVEKMIYVLDEMQGLFIFRFPPDVGR